MIRKNGTRFCAGGKIMELENKKVLVVGTGISGIAATKLLNRHNAKVILLDNNEKVTEDDIRNKMPEGIKADIIIGKLPNDLVKSLDLVVLSPGVPTDADFVNEFRDANIPIWGEIELGYNYAKGKLIAITGTNGKTTTTTLVGQIMKNYFKDVYVIGNIGAPYTDIADVTTDETVTVAEMSSFQLETINAFRPDASAILNITPDHLNRHHTMEGYIEAKAHIFKNQTEKDILVLNYEDKELRRLAETAKTNVLFFSSARKLEYGIYLEGDYIIYRAEEIENIVCNINELKIFGTHSYENVMAAVGLAISMEVPMDIIKESITSFVAVEHRIEYVDTINGVEYYNDSKGTNPDASMKAIEAMKTKTILIGGGYDKGSEYEEWIQAFGGKIKHLILLGQTKEKIRDTAFRLGYKDVTLCENLQEAVELSAKLAEVGECVLLSPACASWGMFKNFEERGCLFKAYVHALKAN